MLLFKNFRIEDGIKDGRQNLKNMDFCALYGFVHEQHTNNKLLTPLIVDIKSMYLAEAIFSGLMYQ